jgi:hypothetical protein
MPARASVWLWLALVAPSLSIVHLHAGGPATIVYVVFATVVVWFAPRVPMPASPRARAWLATSMFVAVAVLFAVVYPRVNVHVPGAGSDDDDALNLGVRALAAGHSPYGERTYLGNELHQLPGAFVLAAPFVAVGSSALQNLFWIPVFFFVVARVRRERATTDADADALRLALLAIVACPVVLDEVVTGTGHGANAIYVAVGLWWLMRTRRPVLAGAVWGVAIASRLNVLVLLPIAFGAVRRRWGSDVAAASTAVAGAVAAAITVPFYLASPGTFGPIESLSRVNVFNQYVPHAGLAIALAMVAAAVWLGAKAADEAAVYAASAVVLAIPVAAGVAFSLPYDWSFALDFAGYGLFATWFVLLWAAARVRR